MRPSTFSIDTLRRFLRHSTTATLPELKRALGTGVDLTVFRKLKQLDCLTSYSHRGRYYALRKSAHFDADGLWSHDQVWFSRHGTLLATAEAFVNGSPKGFFAEELARTLHVETQDVLRQLTRRNTVARGRQQLLEQEAEVGRVRKPGGGRKRVEKRRP